jgi:histidinol-phosphate phosphatase family protein
MSKPLHIDKDWTLFLDRDGVINHEKHNDYIHHWDEFKFYEGVQQAFEIFARKFKHIVIVTNQRGVGKGVTKEADLIQLHDNMQAEIIKHGGRVDAIYYCTDINNEHSHRKPNPGMGLQAAKDLPGIDLNRSIMVGNTLSDMQFGRNIGAYTVFLPTTRPEVDLNDEHIDAVYPSLIDFANSLQ